MTVLFSGFAITDSGKDTVNKIATACLASILWHVYFLKALRKNRLWTRKASVLLVITYLLLLQFYAFFKLYPVSYLFTETGFSLLEILRIGFMGFLLITTSSHLLTLFFLMGWIMLFLLIADKKIINEFWSRNTPLNPDALPLTPRDIGVIENEKVVLSSGYPMLKIFLIRIYFSIPILAVILWFVVKGITAGMCSQIAYCDMPVLFSSTSSIVLSIVSGIIYLFFWLSLQTRQRWTRIVGIAFALLIAVAFHNIPMVLFSALILHYLIFDASIKNTYYNHT